MYIAMLLQELRNQEGITSSFSTLIILNVRHLPGLAKSMYLAIQIDEINQNL